jgi:hypothetical protein
VPVEVEFLTYSVAYFGMILITALATDHLINTP